MNSLDPLSYRAEISSHTDDNAWIAVMRKLVIAVLLMAVSEACFPTCNVYAAEDASLPPTDTIPIESEHSAPQQDIIGPTEQDFLVITSPVGEVVRDIEYILTSPLRLDTESALWLGGAAVGIGGLFLVDNDIQKAFQENRTNATDDIADGLSTAVSLQTTFVANIGLIGTGLWFREYPAGDKLLRTALVSVEAQMFTGTITAFTKLAVGRGRPKVGQGKDSFEPFDTFTFDRSFPSGHSSNAFTVAAVFADRYQQPIPAIVYTVATLVSLSRIHLNEHFASDVFAGAALGYAMGKTLSRRHREKKNQLTFLPFLNNDGINSGGLGLTLEYAF